MNLYCESVVSNNNFVRNDILSVLLKSSADIKEGYRHNVAIIGRGMAGKSSLLLHFLNLIKDDHRLIPIYLNLKRIGEQEFIDAFATMLLYQGLRRFKKLKRPDDLSYLKKSSRKIFPKTYELFKRIELYVNENSIEDAYIAVWDLCLVLASEADLYPIIVIDEFDRLSTFAVKRPFQILGQKIMVQQKSLFILSSSSMLTARKILSEKLSLLFGGFEILDIGPLSDEQAKDFIQKGAKGVLLSEDLIGFLLSITGGHPFYLNAIMQKISFARQWGTDRISIKDLSAIVAELLFHQGGAIHQSFSGLLDELRSIIPYRDSMEMFRRLLIPSRMADILTRCKITNTQLNNLLEKLIEAGMAEKIGHIYTITDPAFRMWVEINTRSRNLCFDFIPSEDAASYAREVEDRAILFRNERRRRLDEKVVDLISSFNNDRLMIDQRLRTLPTLAVTQQQSIGQGLHFILASGKKRWLFVLSNNAVSEEDMYIILDKVKELGYQDVKIILLATSQIEAAAKLLAKQKRIWIWSREDLTRLFQFYKGYSAITA